MQSAPHFLSAIFQLLHAWKRANSIFSTLGTEIEQLANTSISAAALFVTFATAAAASGIAAK
jgi:flagellar motor component MotA